MLDFKNSTSDDFAGFARHLWQEAKSTVSHEQTSQYIVESLYREFVTPKGDPTLALTRIFRLTGVDELPPDVLTLAGRDELAGMALTGTYGMEKAWQNRKTSANHQWVPISKIGVPKRIPMFQEVLSQMGIDLQHLYDHGEIVAAQHSPYTGFFHIPDVPRAAAIPDQETFVKPYGIKSLVGFGGFLAHPVHTCMFILYAFSREFISAEEAQAFHVMQSFVGAALGHGDTQTRVFDH